MFPLNTTTLQDFFPIMIEPTLKGQSSSKFGYRSITITIHIYLDLGSPQTNLHSRL